MCKTQKPIDPRRYSPEVIVAVCFDKSTHTLKNESIPISKVGDNVNLLISMWEKLCLQPFHRLSPGETAAFRLSMFVQPESRWAPSPGEPWKQGVRARLQRRSPSQHPASLPFGQDAVGHPEVLGGGVAHEPGSTAGGRPFSAFERFRRGSREGRWTRARFGGVCLGCHIGGVPRVGTSAAAAIAKRVSLRARCCRGAGSAGGRATPIRADAAAAAAVAADSPDRVGTSNMGFGAGNTEHRPTPSPGRTFLGGLPVDQTLGRPSTIPVIDII